MSPIFTTVEEKGSRISNHNIVVPFKPMKRKFYSRACPVSFVDPVHRKQQLPPAEGSDFLRNPVPAERRAGAEDSSQRGQEQELRSCRISNGLKSQRRAVVQATTWPISVQNIFTKLHSQAFG